MAATTTQTIRLIDCPACGKPIEMRATYDVRLDLGDASAADKTATATLTMTGARIDHDCRPKLHRDSLFTEGGNPLARGGIVTTHNPATRED